jgi:hypothetical protein
MPPPGSSPNSPIGGHFQAIVQEYAEPLPLYCEEINNCWKLRCYRLSATFFYYGGQLFIYLWELCEAISRKKMSAGLH